MRTKIQWDWSCDKEIEMNLEFAKFFAAEKRYNNKYGYKVTYYSKNPPSKQKKQYLLKFFYQFAFRPQIDELFDAALSEYPNSVALTESKAYWDKLCLGVRKVKEDYIIKRMLKMPHCSYRNGLLTAGAEMNIFIIERECEGEFATNYPALSNFSDLMVEKTWKRIGTTSRMDISLRLAETETDRIPICGYMVDNKAIKNIVPFLPKEGDIEVDINDNILAFSIDDHTTAYARILKS